MAANSVDVTLTAGNPGKVRMTCRVCGRVYELFADDALGACLKVLVQHSDTHKQHSA